MKGIEAVELQDVGDDAIVAEPHGVQSEACGGSVRRVRFPIRHPIRRRMTFASTVPARILRGLSHQAKKQS
jgi:hypothetical protein